ncbi:hypothetical protein [Roseivirga sp.]|uniref:hypothetical protein n=1 Tax=Roseivirga sp. TaxID=1964215 RepID=UPI003B8BD4B0
MTRITKKPNTLLKGLLASICLFTVACSYEAPEVPQPDAQALADADISNTVFLGGSLFSGVSNGVLLESTSSQSLPQMFFNSLGQTTDFSATSSNTIGFNIFENGDNLNGSVGPYQLTFPAGADTTFFQEFINGEAFAYAPVNTELKNYSFPKAQVLDFTQAARTENDFITSYLGNNAQSPIDQISASQPSFFVLNLGYEDLLGYSVTGAEGSSDQADANVHTYGDILNTAVFQTNLTEVVDALLANPNAKGALLNIPDFLKFPFFTEVEFDITPYVIGLQVKLGDMRTAASQYNNLLNQYYALNPGFPFADRRPVITYPSDSPFQWGVQVVDNDLHDIVVNGEPLLKVRQVVRDELIYYRHEQFLPTSVGNLPENAVSESQYIKLAEIDIIRAKIAEYNQAIEQVAAASNGRLVVVDIHSYFEELYTGFNQFLDIPAEGINIEGVEFLPVVGEFGIFSADALHLNPRGNALILNQIINTLNANFNGNLNGVNPNDFAGTPINIAGN